MNKVLIIGYGEIGKAFEKICKECGYDVYFKDLKESRLPVGKIEVLHVCIPFKDYENFRIPIIENIKKYSPELVVINSTVEIGTTSKLINDIKVKGVKTEIVYSPCRGVHPNLYDGIKKFIKYIGGSADAIELAASHFETLGVDSKFMSCEEAEAAKLFSTTYYGWNILFCKLVKEFCDMKKLDFDKVYTDWNKSYNKGYKELGMENVVRPILYPPENGINGHCICENWKLLGKDEVVLTALSDYLNKL